MDVKALASVDTWPVHPVRYTLANGAEGVGVLICTGRQSGAGFCYILTNAGESITVPEAHVQRITQSTRVRITINVLE